MHPSTALIAWLVGIVASQGLSYPGLALLAAAALLTTPDILRSWLAFVRRARWLLLTLWLILAFNTPGEAFQDMPWAPTYEGMAEASLQAVRLIVMLGLLAWLFARLGRGGLISGLWGLLLPFQRLGLDTGRLVIRLSLVLENLQIEHENGAWKKMLAGDEGFTDGPSVVHLVMPAWRVRDSALVVLLVIAAGLALAGVHLP